MTNIFETNKKQKNLIRGIKDTKKNQAEILELKYTKTALNNSTEDLNSRLYQAEEKSQPTQRWSFKIIQSEKQKGKRVKKVYGTL